MVLHQHALIRLPSGVADVLQKAEQPREQPKRQKATQQSHHTVRGDERKQEESKGLANRRHTALLEAQSPPVDHAQQHFDRRALLLSLTKHAAELACADVHGQRKHLQQNSPCVHTQR